MKEEHNRYREEEKLENDVQVEEDEIVNEEEVETEIEKLQNSYLRLRADYDNFRKRSAEERAHYIKYAAQPFLEKLINVTDLFDKAVSSKTEDEKLKNYLIGFKMINDSFKQILEEEGVKKIKALGEVFNPVYHHAVEIEYNPEIAEDLIVAEMQSGYLYKDRMLRPSLVIVNKQEERKNEENE